MTSRVRVRVPASTSNIGPGYDVLGCAFQLYNEFQVEVLGEPGAHVIEFSGPQAKGLRPSPRNIFFSSAERLFQRIGRPMPRLHVRAECHVPNARGLGSSSTAVVGALVAADELADQALSRTELLELATQIEGHPDNVAPALLGGMTCALLTAKGTVLSSRTLPHREIGFVVFSPDYEVKTEEARRRLPKSIPHKDAVANLARLPLLIDALVRGNTAVLRELTEDRLHEPYREPLYRFFRDLKAAALEAGAAACCLSGAGPSMLAIGTRDRLHAIAEHWGQSAEALGLTGGAVRVLGVDDEGAQLLPVQSPLAPELGEPLPKL